MLGEKSNRESIGKQASRIGVQIILVLLLVVAMRYVTKLYVVQEILVVLFAVAVSTVAILVLAVVFLLFQEGIRRTVSWTKLGLIRLAHLGPQEQ
jgi:hypothetical protein